jgi:hypothetical protein
MDLNDMIPGVRTAKNAAISAGSATLGFLAGRRGKSNMKKEINKLEKAGFQTFLQRVAEADGDVSVVENKLIK